MPEYYGQKEYASKGVAGTGLGLGAAGLAAALLGGNLLGGGEYRGHDRCHDHFESKEAARLREQLAIVKAEKCAAEGDFELFKTMDAKIDALRAEMGCIDKQIALNKASCEMGDERLWCKMPPTHKFISTCDVITPPCGPAPTVA